MTKDPRQRSGPPENDEEWIFLWLGAGKGHDLWGLWGPLVPVVKNWKWWAAALAVAAWWNRPEIAQAIALITGSGQ